MTTAPYRNRYAPWVLVVGTAAAWLTWRWVALGVEISSLQRRLADNLKPIPAVPTDASRRVAAAIEADESFLDRAIALSSARQMLLWAVTMTWLSALVLFWFWWRTRASYRDARVR